MADLESVPGRVTRAAVAGGGLAFGAVVVAALVAGSMPCRAQGWDCLGYFILGVIGALALAVIVAWPVLHLVGVRPALRVAVCGPLAAGAITWFTAKAPVSGAIAASAWFVEAALGYGIAAFVTSGVIHWRWRVSVALAVVALVPVGSWINTRRAADMHARELAVAGVPLLAPDLPGYRAERTMADSDSRTLRYELTPRTLPSTAPVGERAGKTITVLITPVPPSFAPPARCNFDDANVPDQPCTAAGPNLWRRRTNGPEVDYLTRRGTVLVNVSQEGDSIDEALLRRAVTGMSPRSAAHFR